MKTISKHALPTNFSLIFSTPTLTSIAEKITANSAASTTKNPLLTA
jgi:hypothetical protein